MNPTPGPWHIEKWNPQAIFSRIGTHVASATHGDGRNAFSIGKLTDSCQNDDPEANARLIAAAPDLLAACEAALAERANVGLNRPHWTPGVTERLQAAIAKAKGE